jgi:hypothetical protein
MCSAIRLIALPELGVDVSRLDDSGLSGGLLCTGAKLRPNAETEDFKQFFFGAGNFTRLGLSLTLGVGENALRIGELSSKFPTAVSPEPDPLKRQHHATEEDAHILVTR